MAVERGSPADVVFVAIGRNEGERLMLCLRRLLSVSPHVVYVDSGSADGSVAAAQGLGVNVVELSTNIPFTAARARNAGFFEAQRRWPGARFVMFIDGDCEIAPGFVEAALAAFAGAGDIGIVTGRCRERNRNATIYNRMCDMEWDGPTGDIDACGGIFMARSASIAAVGGFDEAVIAAEDDELCIRVRASGKRIVRVGVDMCLHDANIRHFSQWWRRTERAGHAFSQVGDLHAGYFAASRRRAWIWGLVAPAAILGLAPFSGGWSFLLLAIYPASFGKTFAGLRGRGYSTFDCVLQAGFLTLSKFPTVIGMLKYRWKRRHGRTVGIVEYK